MIELIIDFCLFESARYKFTVQLNRSPKLVWDTSTGVYRQVNTSTAGYSPMQPPTMMKKACKR
jgi:hypothetical protein